MRALIALLPVLLLTGLPALAAAEKREVKNKNFAWTLPSEDWSFADPEAGQVQDGYVLGARHKDGGVTAWARVAPAQGLSTEELTREVETAYTQGVAEARAGKVAPGRLSGLVGHQIVIRGKKGAAVYWFNGIAMKQGDSMHQLLIEAYGGAEESLGAEIDALRRGYRLLEGAGPEEAGEAPSMGKEQAGPDSDAFPPGGPKQEGRAVLFPSHNLRWTLPEGSPFAWLNATDDEKKNDQRLIQAKAVQARKAESEGEPTRTEALVTCFVKPRQAGATAELLVNNAGIQRDITEQVFKGKADASRTKVDGSRKVGNVNGASLMMGGSDGKASKVFVFVVVCLQEKTYEFQVSLHGGKDVTKMWGPAVAALIEGVEFPNTKEAVRGPLQVGGIGASGGDRGQNVDKETEIPIAGGTAKKPKGVGDVPRGTGGDPTMRLAWEARSADGAAYLYFDVRGWSLSDRAVAQRALEEWVKERETEWRTAAGSDAVTVTKGKEPWFDATWGGAKGVGYRFTGSADGHPFAEHGWVVKSKNSVLVLRAQFGGANAEKVLDAVWKAVKKGVKLG